LSRETTPAVLESTGDRPTVAHVMRIYLRATETFVGNQMVTLRRYRPLVLCYRRQPELDYAIADVGVESEMLSGPWKHLDLLNYRLTRHTFPQSVAVLARYALDHKARLLHYHFLVDARFFLDLKRQTRLPAIASAYGYDVTLFPKKLGGAGMFYLRPVLRELDCITAMSMKMRRDLLALGCPEHKVVVHYHGVDTKRFVFPQRTYEEREVATILICASLKPIKSQHLVLSALRLAEHDGMTRRRFRVVLVGDGPTRHKLEQQMAEYGWQDRVTFAGHVPHLDRQLVEHYHAADIFTLTSSTTPEGAVEGIPGTIVEAMASGLPVVSTLHGGIPEIIESGKEGILVPEGDVKSLARAYSDLLNSVSLREKLGSQAATRATTCLDVWPRTAELELIYDNILNGKDPSLGMQSS
jgi:colanic acid/amylovoran biosynthesis glycosyltransferase